jgi:hypothetical protein
MFKAGKIELKAVLHDLAETVDPVRDNRRRCSLKRLIQPRNSGNLEISLTGVSQVIVIFTHAFV